MTGGREKLEQQLRRAGLEIAGDWRVEEVLPPRAAWRPVVAWETEPTVAVRTDRAGLVAELNARWYRLASQAGIFGDDGVFLLDGYRDWPDSAGTPTTRYATVPRPTNGCQPLPRSGSWTTRTTTSGTRPPATHGCPRTC